MRRAHSASAAAAAMALARACTIALVSPQARATTHDHSSPAATEGQWTIEPADEAGQVEVHLHRSWSNGSSRGSTNYGYTVERKELSGIGSRDWSAGNAPVRFDLVRDAGAIHFDGSLRHGRGSGEYSFEPNPGFRAELERAGYRDIQPEDMMRLAFHDIDREYVQELGKLGYERPSADDLVRLKAHGVSPDYVRELLSLASPKPTIDDMVRLHAHGVEPLYVRELRNAGFDQLGTDDIVRLKAHGVTPSDARKAKARFGEVSTDELIRLKSHGAI